MHENVRLVNIDDDEAIVFVLLEEFKLARGPLGEALDLPYDMLGVSPILQLVLGKELVCDIVHCNWIGEACGWDKYCWLSHKWLLLLLFGKVYELLG